MEATVFSIANAYALIGWVLLIFFPRASFTSQAVRYGVIFVLALCYSIVIPMGFAEGQGGGFSSIEGIRALFASDWALVAGWIHYLAFDLFVGLWVNQESTKVKLVMPLRVLCLLGTFMAGPFGLALFIIFRFIKNRTS